MYKLKVFIIFLLLANSLSIFGLDRCGEHPKDGRNYDWFQMTKLKIQGTHVNRTAIICAATQMDNSTEIVKLVYRDSEKVYKSFDFIKLQKQWNIVLDNSKNSVSCLLTSAPLIGITVGRGFTTSEGIKYRLKVRFLRSMSRSLFGRRKDYKEIDFYFMAPRNRNHDFITSYYFNYLKFDRIVFNISGLTLNKILFKDSDKLIRTLDTSSLPKAGPLY